MPGPAGRSDQADPDPDGSDQVGLNRAPIGLELVQPVQPARPAHRDQQKAQSFGQAQAAQAVVGGSEQDAWAQVERSSTMQAV